MLQVMAQGLLLQLWGPLQFLGWFYRELRQSLVDMDAFFGILQTKPNLPDGTLDLPLPSTPLGSAGSNGAVSGKGAVSSNGVQEETRVSQHGMAVELRDVHFGYSGRALPEAGKGTVRLSWRCFLFQISSSCTQAHHLPVSASSADQLCMIIEVICKFLEACRTSPC